MSMGKRVHRWPATPAKGLWEVAPSVRRLLVCCGCGVLVLLAIGPARLLPQEAAQPARAWLGVGLQEVMECRLPGGRQEACRRMLVVSQVVVDGPADRAGVQAGDTLVSLNGRRLAPRVSDAAFAALAPGEPVRLTVGRDDRRVTLRVVPGPRPQGRYTIHARLEGGTTVVRTVDRPAETVVSGDGRRPLVIRGEPGGIYYVRPATGAERERKGVVSGEVGEVAVARALIPRRLEVRARLAGPDSTSFTWVLLEPGPALQAVQESVFRAARVRLDSLRHYLSRNQEQYRRLVGRLRLPRGGEWGWFGTPGRSVAGAEFEPLSPELAESFTGVDEGLLVLRVAAGTPAARLGLRPGDVVDEVAGERVISLEELRGAFVGAEPGEPTSVRWVRGGRRLQGVLRLRK
ncbi:MAG: PDZ domain-containing protein [Gemmatimonadota bacterium]